MPWLTVWDHQMIDCLQPIARETTPPRLEMLFFANTFPLAYHYALALCLSKKEKDVERLISLGEWDQPDKAPIRYLPQDSGHAIPITEFDPKWVFVPLTLATARIWESLAHEDNSDKGVPLMGFLERAKKAGYEAAKVYAELPELGTYLGNILTAADDSWRPTIYTAKKPFGSAGTPPLFAPASGNLKVLRLFIYGGSLSSFLLRKDAHYLPLRIHQPKDPETKKLMLAWISFGKGDAGESHRQSCLRDYHTNLYKATENEATKNKRASTDRCPPFFTVYRAYNEMAWLLQHRSSFRNAAEFARCLNDHHSAPNGGRG